MTNYCTKCKADLPVSEFYQDKRRGTCRPHCKKCRAEYWRSYAGKAASMRNRKKSTALRLARATPIVAPDGFMSMKDAGILLNIKSATLSLQYRNREIDFVNIGKRVYLSAADVFDWVELRKNTTGRKRGPRTIAYTVADYSKEFNALLSLCKAGFTLTDGCKRMRMGTAWVWSLPAELQRELWYAKSIASSGYSVRSDYYYTLLEPENDNKLCIDITSIPKQYHWHLIPDELETYVFPL